MTVTSVAAATSAVAIVVVVLRDHSRHFGRRDRGHNTAPVTSEGLGSRLRSLCRLRSPRLLRGNDLDCRGHFGRRAIVVLRQSRPPVCGHVCVHRGRGRHSGCRGRAPAPSWPRPWTPFAGYHSRSESACWSFGIEYQVAPCSEVLWAHAP